MRSLSLGMDGSVRKSTLRKFKEELWNENDTLDYPTGKGWSCRRSFGRRRPDIFTKMHVFGRGRTKGIRIGDVVYDEFPKTLLLMVVPNENLEKAIQIILEKSKTGTMGDGKIFITEVEEAYTISSGTKGL